MHTGIIDFKENITFPDVVPTALCFDSFIKDIERREAREQTIKAEFYRFLLKKIQAYPGVHQLIDPYAAYKYENVLELVYTALSTTLEDERTFYWALATPLPDKVIYCTTAFERFITAESNEILKALEQDADGFKARQVEFVYRVILEKLYHFPSYLRTDTVYKRINPDTGLMKYYRIHTDTSYVTVKVKGQLPELNPELIESYLYEGAGADVLEKALPLSMFRLEGFSTITIEDYTAQQAIENVRLALVNHSSEQMETYNLVINSLQALAGDPDIDFGLLPFLRVNGKLIFDGNECYNSIIIKSAKDTGMARESFYSLVDNYLKNPRAVFFSSITREKRERYFFLRTLSDAGVQSYAVLPVYYNQRLAGIVEIYSRKKILFYETLLSKLETVIPLLAQLLEETAEKFDAQIEALIKDKFTTLQPAVEWKFNEVAWNYLQASGEDHEQGEMATVQFTEVFPLYGAIDIRNSTVARNDALQNDAELLKQVLSETIADLHGIAELETSMRFKHLSESWLSRIDTMIETHDEAALKGYFQNVVNPVLLHLKDEYPGVVDILAPYETVVDEINGEGFKHRRALEHSIKLINNSLNNYFFKAQAALHNIYPCYFEKFRTDGIEYDIFTGQSLAPDKPFTLQVLKDFRSWQLKSMIEIARLTEALLPFMALPLKTTQLIFVHSTPIDITFRLDERRFDVEGAYNIRYEVIKKRIDKVLIKGTDERLTQPGKIAVVYFTDQEAAEYKGYARAFQQQKMLAQDIEELELDELQGVSGLRALRVAVIF